MPRRRPYTKLEKVGQIRPEHVHGKGDALFVGFQCLNPECQNYIFVRENAAGKDFEITCSECGFQFVSGCETKFFDYALRKKEVDQIIEQGAFVILHDDYIAEALRYKHCLLCYALKPVELFDQHRARSSGFQGECRVCKTVYNGIKNQSRLTDQHREAAQRRRLYNQLAGQETRIDSAAVFNRFGGECFKCSKELSHTSRGQRCFHLDHTLPARLLWPMSTGNATLLCADCNNQKHDSWPSQFYDDRQLRALAILTGYEYELLAGPARINDAAVRGILADVDTFLQVWIPYPEEIKKVRRLIRDQTGVDMYAFARNVPDHLRDPGELT